MDISIHALREEGDLYIPSGALPLSDFYPRPPRGGRQIRSVTRSRQSKISIHALREEGDPTSRYVQSRDLVISIHALREEGDV